MKLLLLSSLLLLGFAVLRAQIQPSAFAGPTRAGGTAGSDSGRLPVFNPPPVAKTNIRVFPNPVKTQFTIQASGFSGSGVMEIFSQQGKLAEKQFFSKRGSGTVTVTLSHPLVRGVYLLQLTDAQTRQQWRTKLMSR